MEGFQNEMSWFVMMTSRSLILLLKNSKRKRGNACSIKILWFSQPSQIDLSLPYDIALLDIDMGETNGIELARSYEQKMKTL